MHQAGQNSAAPLGALPQEVENPVAALGAPLRWAVSVVEMRDAVSAIPSAVHALAAETPNPPNPRSLLAPESCSAVHALAAETPNQPGGYVV